MPVTVAWLRENEVADLARTARALAFVLFTYDGESNEKNIPSLCVDRAALIQARTSSVDGEERARSASLLYQTDESGAGRDAAKCRRIARPYQNIGSRQVLFHQPIQVREKPERARLSCKHPARLIRQITGQIPPTI